METRELERDARKHVRELRDFYIHLVIYLIFMVGLSALNLILTPGFFWAAFPMVGWGLGLAAHAVSTTGLFGIGGKAWEQKKMREYMVQHAGSLDRDDVRAILEEEMASRGAAGSVDLRRLVQRIENLEAIVTSRDWEAVERQGRLLGDDLADEADPGSEEQPEERLRRLSRRVR